MENKIVHRILVDRKACIGAATCVVTAPKVFELDEEDIAIVLPDAEQLDDSQILIAAQSCPTQAIILFDKKGEQIFPKKV